MRLFSFMMECIGAACIYYLYRKYGWQAGALALIVGIDGVIYGSLK